MPKPRKTPLLAGTFVLVSLAAVAYAATSWTKLESKTLGIRLLVPDAEACEEGKDGDVSVLLCDYGELQVAVLAHKGAVDLAELRDAAAQRAEVPEKHWKKVGTWKDQNGYRVAEAWSASGDGHHMLGLIGQSGKRSVSHAVLIFGKEQAWKKHKRDIETFIEKIEAI